MTEQDKQALIEYYCQRDCGHTREECCLDNCHEIMLIEEFPTTPTDTDTISRQAAIDALRKMQTYKLFSGDDMLLIDQAGAQTELMLLPPAQPEQAQWVQMLINPRMYRCSNCNVAWNKRLVFDLDNHNEMFMKYCPCCGKKMLKEVDYE